MKYFRFNYLAVAACCSHGGTPLIRNSLSFYTCSALFKIIYFLQDPGMAFSAPLHGKAHFHKLVVLWRRWLDNPVLPSLALKASGVGGGSAVFPAPERNDEPWDYCPIPSFGKVQMGVWLGWWVWFEAVWVQFITSSFFLSRFGGLQVLVWEQIGDPQKSGIFPSWSASYLMLQKKINYFASTVFIKLQLSITGERSAAFSRQVIRIPPQASIIDYFV